VDFLYAKDRALLSDHVIRLNTTTTSSNITIHPLYTTSNMTPPHPSTRLVLRYNSTFNAILYRIENPLYENIEFTLININWNTNTRERYLFVYQKTEAYFTLYVTKDATKYRKAEYGFNKYYDKYKLVDRRHNPQNYSRKKLKDRGPCNGHIAHTFAMITLVLLASIDPIEMDGVRIKLLLFMTKIGWPTLA
jgi:hypothetical protein